MVSSDNSQFQFQMGKSATNEKGFPHFVLKKKIAGFKKKKTSTLRNDCSESCETITNDEFIHCLLCPGNPRFKIKSKNSISFKGLKLHMKEKHPSVFQHYHYSPKKKNFITNYINTNQTKEEALLNCLIANNFPFNALESPEFKSLFLLLGYDLPSRTTMANKINAKFEIEKESNLSYITIRVLTFYFKN